jgi:hypothetical protein
MNSLLHGVAAEFTAWNIPIMPHLQACRDGNSGVNTTCHGQGKSSVLLCWCSHVQSAAPAQHEAGELF